MFQIISFHKLALFLGVVLACTTSLSSEASSLIENFKEQNELVGPVHKTITKNGDLTIIDTYNPSGNLIEEVTEFNGNREVPFKHISKHIFTYDDRGLPSEFLLYGDDGTLDSRRLFRFSFNENGSPAAMVAAKDDGSYEYSEFWVYDDRGNLAAKFHFGDIEVSSKSLFDVQGKVIYAIYNGDYEFVKHYNFKGELVESLHYMADGVLLRKVHYKYDEAGRLIEEASDFYNVGLRKSLKRYEFDTYGNWVRQTVEEWAEGNDSTKPDQTRVIRERIIHYY
jgi:antitoxin component YwqK of YwqJK toxin-antitoxin module